MQYRRFGSLDFSVSALGFGAMRLPMKTGKVDEPLAISIIRSAIDRGVNYVDTAYPYHDDQPGHRRRRFETATASASSSPPSFPAGS